MKIIDIVPNVLIFFIALYGMPSVKRGSKAKSFTVIIFLFIVMGFSIYQSSANTLSANEVKKANDSLIVLSNNLNNKFNRDSLSNTIFQTYLRDTLGIYRKGNRAVIYNTNNFQEFYKSSFNITQSSDVHKDFTKVFTILSDSNTARLSTPGSTKDIEQYRLTRNGVELEPNQYFSVTKDMVYLKLPVMKGDKIIIHWRN